MIHLYIVITSLRPHWAQKALLSPKRYSSAMWILMASPTIGAVGTVRIELLSLFVMDGQYATTCQYCSPLIQYIQSGAILGIYKRQHLPNDTCEIKLSITMVQNSLLPLELVNLNRSKTSMGQSMPRPWHTMGENS